jgi:protein-S-isoprenylcysteine O-methyltransferase Ste14
MANTADSAQVFIQPPLAWGLALITGLGLDWLVPLPFLPADLSVGWLGAMVLVLALALGICSVVTIIRARSNIPTNRPTITIVESGPYRFTRNPTHLGMFLGQIGLADDPIVQQACDAPFDARYRQSLIMGANIAKRQKQRFSLTTYEQVPLFNSPVIPSPQGRK